MNYLPIVLISSFFFSIILTFLSYNKRMTAIEIVNNMGMGWNLGNTFDSYDINYNFKDIDETITFWGNKVPTKEIFIRLKKYGFKTIRFPVTWMTYMDESGKVKKEWMSRVKEVVDWILSLNMYCIINVFHDGASGNWLSKGIIAKEKYIALWSQIAEEFKYYDEYLVFESMNDVVYKTGDNYEYDTLLSLTQAFVDTIRNSKGNNNHRLLLISGADSEIELTCSSGYLLPKDPNNKLGVSLHYYRPSQFTVERDDEPYTWTDESGNINIIQPMTKWGSEGDYKDMFSNFELMKKTFVDKGIAVIIVEVGVLTEQKKEIESIREYLYAEFSMSASYNGIMSCLWDTSVKNPGGMCYYDRVNDKWNDQIIKDNLKKISRGKYINPQDYYIISNIDKTTNISPDGHLHMQIGNRKVKTIYFNCIINTKLFYNAVFGVVSSDKRGNWIGESISASEAKRQYDGSYTITIDAINKDLNDYIEIQKWWLNEYIIFNYLTVEFDKNYTFFDYNEYKKNF